MTDMPASQLVPYIFENKQARLVMIKGEPWFVAGDVCRILDLANVSMALRILDEDEKGVSTVDTPGGTQQISCVSEPGMYKLVGRSRKPEAKRFDRWIRHVVLPSIRKNGGYIAGQEKVATGEMSDIELLARAVQVGSRIIDEQKAKIAELTPKADALDRIAAADGSLCITDAAKALQTPPRALFKFLQAHHWIYRRSGSEHWVGYQAHIQNADLETKVTTVKRSDGTDRIAEQVRITSSGLAKLAKRMGGQSQALAA